MPHHMLSNLTLIRPGRTRRSSSWETSGCNSDAWLIEPGQARILADLQGPKCP